MKTLLVLATLALSLNGAAFAGFQGQDKLDKCNKDTRIPATATIAKGVDGDTVHIKTDVGTFSVRMLGMDTPETHFYGKSQGKWGEEAARVMDELLPLGTQVTVQVGVEGCDMHGRVLAYLSKDGMNVNAEMLKRGLAVNYCVAPELATCDEFARYTQNAIDRKLGMFSEQGVELPYDFRRRIENQPQRSYVGNLETKEVHSPGHQNDVPVADRVFFFTKESVQSPYHLVD
jgi:micrococcal nuclease